MLRPPKTIFPGFLLRLIFVITAVPALGQQQTPADPNAPQASEYKMTTPIPVDSLTLL